MVMRQRSGGLFLARLLVQAFVEWWPSGAGPARTMPRRAPSYRVTRHDVRAKRALLRLRLFLQLFPPSLSVGVQGLPVAGEFLFEDVIVSTARRGGGCLEMREA